MRHTVIVPAAVSALLGLAALASFRWGGMELGSAQAQSTQPHAGGQISARGKPMIEEGKYIFRYDTFGDEQLWTDVLRVSRLTLKRCHRQSLLHSKVARSI